MFQPSTLLKVAVPGLIAAVVVGVMLASSSNQTSPADEGVQAEAETASQAASKPEAMTIGGQWNWSGVNMQRTKKAEANAKAVGSNGVEENEFPYTPEVIYQALEKVRLDKAGNLVIDHVTLAALMDALGSTRALLSDEHIAVLQEIIQVGLAGPAGEQAVQLVGSFHGYLKASADLIELNTTPTTPSEQRKQLEEMQALRAVHLGDDVAKGLFGQSDTDFYYMIESMDIQSMSDLSQEEKAIRQQAVVDKHINDTIAVHHLEEKYRNFVAERDQILASYQDEAERDAKVNEALAIYFTPQERETIQHLPIARP